MAGMNAKKPPLLIVGVLFGFFVLLCAGVIVIAAVGLRNSGYGAGYRNYADPKGRFTVDAPKNYTFTITHSAGGKLKNDIHEAKGLGAIQDFFILVVEDYGSTGGGGLQSEQLLDISANDMAKACTGVSTGTDQVQRRSGVASRHTFRGLDNKLSVVLVMESYLDGEDLVMVGFESTDMNAAKDPVGQHFFDTFTIANLHERQAGSAGAAVKAPFAPNVPNKFDVLKEKE